MYRVSYEHLMSYLYPEIWCGDVEGSKVLARKLMNIKRIISNNLEIIDNNYGIACVMISIPGLFAKG